VVLRVEALRERLAKLEEVVGRLRDIAVVNRDEFLRSYQQQWVAERGLELALIRQKIPAPIAFGSRDSTPFAAVLAFDDAHVLFKYAPLAEGSARPRLAHSRAFSLGIFCLIKADMELPLSNRTPSR
jgi:hypothetical protein